MSECKENEEERSVGYITKETLNVKYEAKAKEHFVNSKNECKSIDYEYEPENVVEIGVGVHKVNILRTIKE